MDSEASKLLSVRFLDSLASIYRPNRSDPNDFESYELAQEKVVSLFPQLLQTQQKQVLYRNILGLNEFMLYYEAKAATFYLRIIVTNGGSVKLYEFRKLEHPQPKKVFIYHGI